MKRIILVSFIGLAGLLWTSADAEAITAWARRYNVDCSACHAGPMYKLTPLGTEFLRRGR